jgi:4-amino-4-deoxy-L-arabinose transferase-like glycosyltransferase
MPTNRLARAPVFSAMAALAVVLTATSGRYGYHRDELYFRMLHPAWGYIDEPPLTPLLARAFNRAIADEVWAMRIPATVAAVAAVYVLALITRELGGGRTAQALCAWGYAFAALPLVMGHALLTSTIDLPVWPAVVLCVIRAQLRRQPRWWLAAGLVVGLSMYNKLLVAVLLVALGAGLAFVGPRRLLWSKWVIGGIALALVIGSPNLIYQATHHWPQLSMGRALSDNNAGSVRIIMWPFLLIILGPPLVPIWIAGIVRLVRAPEWRPVRFVAAAFPVLLVLVFAMGSQFYYPFGLLAVLFAAGCVPAARWMVRWRRDFVVAGVALNAAVSLVLGLPLVPLSALGSTPVPGINQVAQDSVGWPVYVRQIAAVFTSLPAVARTRVAIVASNYGEAGAIERYGPHYRLPRVYSGQNQLWYDARPPATATSVIFVGGQFDDMRSLFRSCAVVARLDNEVGVDNEEQGEPIAVCRNPIGGWATVWPDVRHED